MTTMTTEIYDAFREAGASEQRSRAAAETLLSYDDKFAKMVRRFDIVDRRMDELEHRIDSAKMELKADNRFLQWQIGLVLAGILALIVRTFFGP